MHPPLLSLNIARYSPTCYVRVAAIAGTGMAMLYPNLSAAVADIAHPSWRASAIGIYRLWRDLGYGIGALGLGVAAALGGRIEGAFWFVAVAMMLSGAVLNFWATKPIHVLTHHINAHIAVLDHYATFNRRAQE